MSSSAWFFGGIILSPGCRLTRIFVTAAFRTARLSFFFFFHKAPKVCHALLSRRWLLLPSPRIFFISLKLSPSLTPSASFFMYFFLFFFILAFYTPRLNAEMSFVIIFIIANEETEKIQYVRSLRALSLSLLSRNSNRGAEDGEVKSRGRGREKKQK